MTVVSVRPRTRSSQRSALAGTTPPAGLPVFASDGSILPPKGTVSR